MGSFRTSPLVQWNANGNYILCFMSADHYVEGQILELPLEQLWYQQYHAPLDHLVLIGLIKFLISRDCLMMEVSL